MTVLEKLAEFNNNKKELKKGLRVADVIKSLY